MTDISLPLANKYKEALVYISDSSSWTVPTIQKDASVYAPFDGRILKMQLLKNENASYWSYLSPQVDTYSLVFIANDNTTNFYVNGVSTSFKVGDKLKANDYLGTVTLPDLSAFNFMFFNKKGESK